MRVPLPFRKGVALLALFVCGVAAAYILGREHHYNKLGKQFPLGMSLEGAQKALGNDYMLSGLNLQFSPTGPVLTEAEKTQKAIYFVAAKDKGIVLSFNYNRKLIAVSRMSLRDRYNWAVFRWVDKFRGK